MRSALPRKIPGDDALHPVASDSVRAVNGWLFRRPVPCLGHPDAKVITRTDMLAMRHRSEVVRFQPLLHVHTVHARLARAQIVVETRATDTTSLQRQFCVDNGGDGHPAIRRRAAVVKPQVDRRLAVGRAHLSYGSITATITSRLTHDSHPFR